MTSQLKFEFQWIIIRRKKLSHILTEIQLIRVNSVGIIRFQKNLETTSEYVCNHPILWLHSLIQMSESV